LARFSAPPSATAPTAALPCRKNSLRVAMTCGDMGNRLVREPGSCRAEQCKADDVDEARALRLRCTGCVSAHRDLGHRAVTLRSLPIRLGVRRCVGPVATRGPGVMNRCVRSWRAFRRQRRWTRKGPRDTFAACPISRPRALPSQSPLPRHREGAPRHPSHSPFGRNSAWRTGRFSSYSPPQSS
jgi:hypothetical protein